MKGLSRLVAFALLVGCVPNAHKSNEAGDTTDPSLCGQSSNLAGGGGNGEGVSGVADNRGCNPTLLRDDALQLPLSTQIDANRVALPFVQDFESLSDLAQSQLTFSFTSDAVLAYLNGDANRYLRLEDRSAKDRIEFTRSFEPASSKLSVQWSFREIYHNNWTNFLLSDGREGAIQIAKFSYGIQLRIASDGPNQWLKLTPGSIGDHRWFKIRIDLDNELGTYDVYVNDLVVKTGLPYLKSGARINTFTSATSYELSNVVDFDDFSIIERP